MFTVPVCCVVQLILVCCLCAYVCCVVQVITCLLPVCLVVLCVLCCVVQVFTVKVEKKLSDVVNRLNKTTKIEASAQNDLKTLQK